MRPLLGRFDTDAEVTVTVSQVVGLQVFLNCYPTHLLAPLTVHTGAVIEAPPALAGHKKGRR